MSVVEWIGGLGSAVGGVGAAGGAAAAWRAATASRETSRDALEALAVGIRPWLDVDAVLSNTTHEIGLRISNPSAWPATDVRLEVHYRDGRVDRDNRERVDPERPGEGWARTLTGVLAANVDPFANLRQQVDGIVLTYSDQRDIARYRVRFPMRPSPGGPFGLPEQERIR